MEKLLCDTTSIEHIYNSNHTLEITENYYLSERSPEILTDNLFDLKKGFKQRLPGIISFWILTYLHLSIPLLSRVLALIEGEPTNQYSAIFRLLRTILNLCNVSSREVLARLQVQTTNPATSVKRLTKSKIINLSFNWIRHS